MPPTATVPYDKTAAALSILGHTAMTAVGVMLPVAELTPNNSVILNGLAVAMGATTPGIQLQWPFDGLLVGVRANSRDGLQVSLSNLLLRIQVDGRDELFPSGTGGGAGFLPFYNISGDGSQLGRYATRRVFTQSVFWTVYLMNTSGGNLTADLTFDVINTSTPTA